MLSVLRKQGVSQYNPVNEKFNPDLHNALFEVRQTCDCMCLWWCAWGGGGGEREGEGGSSAKEEPFFLH